MGTQVYAFFCMLLMITFLVMLETRVHAFFLYAFNPGLLDGNALLCIFLYAALDLDELLLRVVIGLILSIIY
jgi:hypothetical protein